MIHRILRSWWLYPLLAVLLVYIYAVSGSLKVEKPQPAQPMLIEDPLELWPKELDGDVIMGVMSKRPVLGWFLFLLVGTMGGLFAGGIALSVHDFATRRVRALWGPASRPLPPWSLGDGWRIFALILFVAGLLPFLPGLWGGRISGPMFPALMVMLGLDLFVILAVLAFAQGKDVTVRTVFLGEARDVKAALSASFRQYVTAFPWLFLLLFLIARIVKTLNIRIPPEEIQKLLFSQQEPRVFMLVMLLACVVAPVAEELFFRGVIFGGLRRKSSRWVAMLGSATAFALVHTNPIGFLPIMALGCLLADLHERTGTLLAPVAVHIFHNTLLISLAMTFRQFLLPQS